MNYNFPIEKDGNKKKRRRKRGVFVLPNLLTTASLFCGFYSVIASMKGGFSRAAVCMSNLKKAPGRTEFQRGVLAQDTSGNWSVRVTGEQGSGILRSMSEANCFIILPEAQGNVAAGMAVEVQVMEGVV